MWIPFINIDSQSKYLLNNTPSINIQQKDLILTTGSKNLRMTSPRIRHTS